jgi:hypothetical protein
MKYNKQCECCGNKVTAYSHNLNAPLVQAFEQLVKFYLAKNRGASLQKDLNLTKNQYNNFQKLQYFGLVANYGNGWTPTLLGLGFITGDKGIMNPVGTFGKEILSNYHEAWRTTDRKPKLTHISQVKGYTWKGRDEYQEEKGFNNQTLL